MIQTVKPYLLLALIFLTGYHQVAAQMNPDTIINRYYSWLVNTEKIPDETAVWVKSLDENGQWDDIRYQDTSRGGWGPASHIKRVRDIALAWSDERNKGYRTELYWQAIQRSLNHWLMMRYQCTNWWYNEIGVPRYFKDIITLTRHQLTASQLKQSLEVFNQVKIKGVGANLTWTADLGLHYGAFTNDGKKMDSCSKLIAGEIKISKGDGIQPDYSFHQHGPRLQSFHYGRSFLFDNARLAWELRGTTWALPQEKIDLLLGLLLNGDQWMTRGSSTVPGTVDRAVSRPKQLDVSDISDILPYLMEVSPGIIPALTALDKRLKGTGQPLTGFRYYPYSDFAAFQQPSFAFFLKTQSNRTKNTESINSENLKGRFLNNGTTWFMKTGKEYMDMMPLWNWERLPGLANVAGCVKQEGLAFTGSVSDSVSGLTATDNIMLTESSQVNTHQIWAAHNNAVVILTVFIPEKNKAVPSSAFLSMDQSRLHGEVVVSGDDNVSKEGVYDLKNTTWLYHAGFAYIPIQPSTVNLYMDTVTGSWASINTSIKADTVSDNIFMPVIEMPITANGISAGYGVVSCASAAEARSLAQKPAWRVLRNDKDHQAVLFSDGLLMSAFFTAGTLKISEKETITVSHPCLLMKDASGQVTVSDPSRTYNSVSITIGGKKKNISLNKEGYSVSEQW